MITIVCTAKSHPRKVVALAEFHRRMDDRTLALFGLVNNWTADDWVIDWGKIQGQNRSAADAHDVRYGFSDHPDPNLRDTEGNHTRYRLECRLCGLCVVAVEGKLVPLLKKAHEAGVSVIPLADLAASLI
jgi:hypothetical protein